MFESLVRTLLGIPVPATGLSVADVEIIKNDCKVPIIIKPKIVDKNKSSMPPKTLSITPIPQALELLPKNQTSVGFNNVKETKSDVSSTDNAPIVIDCDTVPPVEVKKKKKKKKEENKPKSKVKPWPKNTKELVNYEELVAPLKAIIDKGYRLGRFTEIKSFEYEGYDVGDKEAYFTYEADKRFTEPYLTYELNTFKRNLIDVVFNQLFLLGVEQGRRAEKSDPLPTDGLIDAVNSYKEENKELRIKVDRLSSELEIIKSNPNISESDLLLQTIDLVKSKRNIRIKKLKEDLKLDTSKSSFKFNEPKPKKPFNEMVNICSGLNKDICSIDEWKQILHKNGWSFESWQAKCKKKHIVNYYS